MVPIEEVFADPLRQRLPPIRGRYVVLDGGEPDLQQGRELEHEAGEKLMRGRHGRALARALRLSYETKARDDEVPGNPLAARGRREGEKEAGRFPAPSGRAMLTRLREEHPRAVLPAEERLSRLLTASVSKPYELAEAPLLQDWALFYGGELLGWSVAGKLMGASEEGGSLDVRGIISTPRGIITDTERHWVAVEGRICRLGDPL